MRNCVLLHRMAEGISPSSYTKLIQLSQGTGIDWCKQRVINKLYINQSVKYEWTKGRQEV